jgi:putative tricarboxylic transport membrane protein
MAEVALKFGPPEYFSLMFLAMTVLIYMGRGSLIKSLTMAALGLFLGWVGMDVISGQPRFTFGMMDLMDGIGLVPMLMGIFGISEVLLNVEKSGERSIFKDRIRGLLPSREDWKASIGPIARGSLLGFFFGILPGSGGIISTFASYTLEKKISKYPERFGTGVIEGVAGPETANNAATGGAYIPLLTLGLPSNVSMAVLLGALMIYGVQPGPLLLEKNPDLFWGVITSLYIGNLMLLVLNLPLIGLWVKILKIPYPLLYPLIILFCFVGAYSLNHSIFEVGLMAGFGVFGYLLRKFDYEPTPLVLGMVLGPMFENAFRQTMLLSRGSFAILFTRPIAAVFTIVALLLFLSPLLPILKSACEKKYRN